MTTPTIQSIVETISAIRARGSEVSEVYVGSDILLLLGGMDEVSGVSICHDRTLGPVQMRWAETTGHFTAAEGMAEVPLWVLREFKTWFENANFNVGEDHQDYEFINIDETSHEAMKSLVLCYQSGLVRASG